MKAILIILLLPVIYYVLYNNGYMLTGKKTARVFVAKNRGTNAYWVQFVECSGELKRVARFRQSRDYRFYLNVGLAGGTVAVELLNREKQVVLRLTPEEPEGSLTVDKKQKYYAVYRFKDASGAYEMTWE